MDNFYSTSIKKDIVKLLESPEARVELNYMAHLYRWTVNALGEPVDGLELELSYIGGITGGEHHSLQARDYDGIMQEVSIILVDYFHRCAAKMARNLRNGYRDLGT